MKLTATITVLSVLAFACIGFLVTAPITGCASNGSLTPTAATDIQNALLTSENVLQQLNTGLQTAAPSIDTLLTLTHNQGDASAVNNVVAESAAAAPALNALLATVNAAIKSSSTPQAQVAAVNAALSPTTAAAIVAPIAASATVAPVPASSVPSPLAPIPTTDTWSDGKILLVRTDLRPIFGWCNAYDVRMARN